MTLSPAALTVDGVDVPLAGVLADLTIRHGRADVFDSAAPSTFQATLLGVSKATTRTLQIGAVVVFTARDGAAAPAPRFTGRLTDASLEDDVLTLIAVGPLSTLKQYKVGAADYPAETWSARVTRAFTEADVPLDTPNLCTNPGFETDLAGWGAPVGGVTLARDTAEHHSGKASAHAVTPGAVEREWIYYEGGTYEAGVNYRGSFWIKGTAGAEMYAYLISSIVFFTLTGAWQQVDLPSFASTSTVAIQLFILTRHTPPAQAVDFHLDDVVIVAERGVLELVPPPAASDPLLAARVALDEGQTTLADYLDELAGTVGAAVVDRPDGRILVQAIAARTLESSYPVDPAEVAFVPAWVQVLPQTNVVTVKYAGDLSVTVDEPASIAIYGPRPETIETTIVDVAAATSRAAERLSRAAFSHWNMPAAPLLVGRPLEIGQALELSSFPPAAPYDPWTPVLEGWTDAIVSDGDELEWTMELALSDPLASGLTLPWAAVPAADTWATIDQALEWKDALTLSDLNPGG